MSGERDPRGIGCIDTGFAERIAAKYRKRYEKTIRFPKMVFYRPSSIVQWMADFSSLRFLKTDAVRIELHHTFRNLFSTFLFRERGEGGGRPEIIFSKIVMPLSEDRRPPKSESVFEKGMEKTVPVFRNLFSTFLFWEKRREGERLETFFQKLAGPFYSEQASSKGGSAFENRMQKSRGVSQARSSDMPTKESGRRTIFVHADTTKAMGGRSEISVYTGVREGVERIFSRYAKWGKPFSSAVSETGEVKRSILPFYGKGRDAIRGGSKRPDFSDLLYREVPSVPMGRVVEMQFREERIDGEKKVVEKIERRIDELKREITEYGKSLGKMGETFRMEADIGRISEQVYREIEEKMRIERFRRGL